ncbi:MAG: sigma-70 family RNA polymerase sigma factor [Fuerstiella sp.]
MIRPPGQDSSTVIPPQALLSAARAGRTDRLAELLQYYRHYLTKLASARIGHRLRARVSASDVVQDTVLEVVRDFQNFQGRTDREFLAWLRQILINNLMQTVERHWHTGKRDVRREIRLQQVTSNSAQSAAGFEQFPPSPVSSPSTGAQRRETGVLVADHLARLSDQHREVIILRNLQGLSFDDVARRLDRTPGAVRMLWLRAMERFRELVEGREMVHDQ